jgi:hypothetical protein
MKDDGWHLNRTGGYRAEGGMVFTGPHQVMPGKPGDYHFKSHPGQQGNALSSGQNAGSLALQSHDCGADSGIIHSDSS